MTVKKLKLPFKIKKPVLALGGHGKNTLCFARGNSALLSNIHPDLSEPNSLFGFEKELKNFLRKKPKVIAYDLHPEYQSTRAALNLDARRYRLYAIQHHHAHIAACMADNCLKNQKVIGVAFDGTGLGDDNALWGAEFLICDYSNFKRAAHLKEAALLGAEKAILEPWRTAAWWLYSIYKEQFLNLKINFVKGIDRKRWEVLERMSLSGFNSPYASSMGRLFDAVASIVLVKYKAGFEAELAMELEKAAVDYGFQAKSYEFRVERRKGVYLINPLPMFRQIVSDLHKGESREKIACRFHLTVAEMIVKICLLLEKNMGINTAVLSGGVFQNNLLLSLTKGLLYKEGFRVFSHNKLAANDSALSFGQVIVANFRVKCGQYKKSESS